MRLALAFVGGCLPAVYEIPREELRRLGELPPAERGDRVRVVQPLVAPSPPPDEALHGGGRGELRLNLKGGNDAAAVLVIAGVVAVGLAVTEGVRYDGWVELDPDHPIRLAYPWREWSETTLSDPDLAAVGEGRAFVTTFDRDFAFIARRRLDRRGLAYGVDWGATTVDAADDGESWGFLGRVQIGAFPTQRVGVLASVGFAWGDFDNDAFGARWGCEVQGYPLTVRRVSAGGYGMAGFDHQQWSAGDDRTTVRSGAALGLGALLQLELTTTMALTLRGGVTRLANSDETRLAPEIALGLAIY